MQSGVGNVGPTRREFMVCAAGAAALGALAPGAVFAGGEPAFRISLAQWSLHRALFSKEIDAMDFPRVARERYGIGAVELVNQFFMDRARDGAYLKEMKRRAGDAGVSILLVMCDGIGEMGDPDPAARGRVVDGHVRWLEAAAVLGCHSIRVNAGSKGGYEEQQKLAADGLHRLSTLAVGYGLNVIVENHGGLSSNGAWLAGVIDRVGLANCGTLPDFGNFCMDWSREKEADAWYDRYLGVEQLMPFAKAVSAKSHEFDDEGNEVRTDYLRMMRIVLDAGYTGYVGIEYEGETMGEHEGILATKKLLERVRGQLAD
jgi:sugar phosphate isomerase/epimerase